MFCDSVLSQVVRFNFRTLKIPAVKNVGRLEDQQAVMVG